jgi:hypothetical protein
MDPKCFIQKSWFVKLTQNIEVQAHGPWSQYSRKPTIVHEFGRRFEGGFGLAV